jgi:hypothetical protein
MECAKYVTYKTLLEKNVVKKETEATFFIKSIEYKDNQYIFYAEEGDGPITYKNGMNIYYSKTDNTVSFTFTIDNRVVRLSVHVLHVHEVNCQVFNIFAFIFQPSIQESSLTLINGPKSKHYLFQ